MDLTVKTGNLGARKGNHYQAHLLMWIQLVAASDDDEVKKYSNYRLTTEMAAAGKFDDAVLSWTGAEGEKQWLFVQVKHKMSFKLNQDHLFSPNGDFSIFKYLLSIVDIERNNNFSGQKQYVIFTNGAVDKTIEHWFKNVDNEAEEVLKFPKSKTSESKFLRIKLGSEQNNEAEKENKNSSKDKGKTRNTVEDKSKIEIEQFYNQLIEYVNKDFKGLVQALMAIFFEGKSDVKTDVFMKYNCALVGKIFEIEMQFVKFTKKFIKQIDLEASEQMLWSELFKNDNTPEQPTKTMITSKNKQLIAALQSKKHNNYTLPPFIGMKDLESVFRRFIFAVNQPNNDELKSIITDELESRHGCFISDKASRACFSSLGFIKLEKMIDDCIDSPNVEYLKKERVLEELQAAKYTINNSKLDVHTEIFKGKIQNLRVEFEELGFLKTQEDLLKHVPLAIITSTQRGWLTSIKLGQMLKKEHYRYISFKQLKNSSTRQMLLDVLKDCSSTYYLVLRDDGSEFDFARELFDNVPPGTTLRLILLTHQRERISKLFKDDAIIEDNANSFPLLSKQSRDMLQTRQINFQGSEILFRDLEGYSQLSSVLQNELLEKLVLGEILSIGPNLPEMKTKHYIPRVIQVKQNRYWYNNFGTEKEFLECLPKLNPHNKIMVLSSIPGMGKSTLWTRLAQLAKQLHSSVWILHIKLQDCSRHLNTKTKIENLDNTIDFLCTTVSLQSDPYFRSLLENRLQNEQSAKVYIFFDGFDELSYEYTDQIITLLKFLAGKATVFVNTREHRQEMLESNFDIIPLSLEPMDKKDLRRYFASFSHTRLHANFADQLMEKIESESMKLARKCIGTPLIAHMLIEIFTPIMESRQMNEDVSKLDISDIFEKFFYSSFYRQKVKKYKDPEDPELDQTGIFYKAVERLHNFLGLKSVIDQDTKIWMFSVTDKRGFLKKSEKIDNIHSVKRLIDQRITEVIVSSRENEEFHQQARQLQSPIVEYGKDFIHFIHMSFAEFSAAKYLYDHLTSMMDDQVVVKFVKARPTRVVSNEKNCNDLFSIYFMLLEDYPMVRKFFFEIIRRNSSKSFLNDQFYGAQKTEDETKKCNKNELLAVFTFKRIGQMLHCMRPYTFMWVCGENFEELMSHLVSEDPKIVHQTFYFKNTILHYAASQNADGICKLLIKNGADVNARSTCDLTPLHEAVFTGALKVVKLLMENKDVDKNPRTRRIITPLYLACYFGYTNIVRVLLDNNCGFYWEHDALNKSTLDDIDDKDWFDLVCRMVDQGFYKTIDVLFEYLERNFFDWKSTLLWAIVEDFPHVIKAMLKVRVNIFEMDYTGNSITSFPSEHRLRRVESTIVHMYPAERNLFMHLYLSERYNIGYRIRLYRKVNIIAVNGQRMTPVFLTVKFGRPEMLKLLLKASGTVNDKFLHTAIKFTPSGDISSDSLDGHSTSWLDNFWLNLERHEKRKKTIRCIKIFLTHGVNLTLIDEERRTSLHVATAKNDLQLVKILLKYSVFSKRHHMKLISKSPKGVNPSEPSVSNNFINQQDNEGQTALHLACTLGNTSIIRKLIKRGADVKIKNNKKQTPLHSAASEGHWDVVQILLRNGTHLCAVDNQRMTHGELAAKPSDCIKYINQQDIEGQTILHLACAIGKTFIIEKLIDAGADISCENNKKQTPLHLAATGEHCDVVEILLQQRANLDADCINFINKQDNKGQTSLHLACILGNTSIINKLIKRGADFTKENSKKQTPLHSAASVGQRDVVQILLRHGTNLDASDTQRMTHGELAAKPSDCIKYINQQDNEGQTALHLACAIGKTFIIEKLINAGADVNCENNKKQSPLHLATTGEYWDIATILLRHGANSKSADNQRMASYVKPAAFGGHLDFLLEYFARVPLSHSRSFVKRMLIIAAKNRRTLMKLIAELEHKVQKVDYPKGRITTKDPKVKRANKFFRKANNRNR